MRVAAIFIRLISAPGNHGLPRSDQRALVQPLS
jgi:hypothetical protein